MPRHLQAAAVAASTRCKRHDNVAGDVEAIGECRGDNYGRGDLRGGQVGGWVVCLGRARTRVMSEFGPV